MRLRKITLAAVAVAAGLSLTACQGGGDDNASSSKGGGEGSTSSQAPGKSGSGGEGGENAGSGEGGSDAGDAGKGDAGKGGSGQGGSGQGGSDEKAGSGNTGTQHAGTSSGTCKTSQLAISSRHGMGEGDILVHLENTGAASCTLKGFPGVDLKGKDGTLNATRSDLSAPVVTIKPGDETRFTLHYTPNTSGGSGVTFDRMVVTPPNETHSKTVRTSVNLPVSDGSDSSSVRVDPVGTGK